MQIKTVTISVKHSDMAVMTLENEADVEVFEHDGYMPDMGVFEGGDYTELTIDNATGKIVGWKSITPEDVARFKKENGDDEDEGEGEGEEKPEDHTEPEWKGKYKDW
jgi:hypothetical protein